MMAFQSPLLMVETLEPSSPIPAPPPRCGNGNYKVNGLALKEPPCEGSSAWTIPADSTIRRFHLLALIDATKHPQIDGHPNINIAAHAVQLTL